MVCSRSFVVLGAVLSLVIASSLLAADKPHAKKPQPPVAEDPQSREHEMAIEQALLKPTQFVFVELPLDQVVEYLKDYHKIEIQIDAKALNDVAIGTNTPVTRNLKGISLRSALRLMLKELGLTYLIKDEVLLITTPEEADNLLTRKVLDVSDLVVYRTKKGNFYEDYELLGKVITSTIMPTTWDCVGGPGTIAGASLGTAKVLVVNQTHYVHHEIAKLLADIREIAKKNPDGYLPRRDKPSHSAKGLARPDSSLRSE